MNSLERYDVSPERAWLAGLVGGLVALVGAAVAFTEQVYYGFIWRYFWGPVHADAISVDCLVYLRDVDRIVGFDQPVSCARTPANFVARPGYTIVSEIGYMIALVFFLAGIYLLLRRFEFDYRDFFFALVPFMLFGGALRVVEDALDRGLTQGFQIPLEYPLNTLFISPLIYFTVFVVALAAFLLSMYLDREDVTETFHYPLAAAGTAAFGLTAAYLTFLAFTTDYVDFHPTVFLLVVGLASLIAVGSYYALERFAPWVNEGTRYMGVVVVWAHAIDGVANVIASDWAWVWGMQLYGSKHPIDRILANIITSIQGEQLTAALGDSWLFLVVKVAVAVAILAVFEEEFIEESPRYAVTLLGAIVAVGLGPGTRDMIRVTLGI